MAARGVAEMTSKISSADEEDDASLWWEEMTGGEEFLWWLARDDEALVGALRGESASGVNEG
jgi:hypothetical protein